MLNKLFSSKKFSHNESIPVPNGTDLLKCFAFDIRKTTVFFAAGFTNDLDSIWSQAIIGGYLSQGYKYNVIQINYTYYSLKPVLKAFPYVPQVRISPII